MTRALGRGAAVALAATVAGGAAALRLLGATFTKSRRN